MHSLGVHIHLQLAYQLCYHRSAEAFEVGIPEWYQLERLACTGRRAQFRSARSFAILYQLAYVIRDQPKLLK